MKDIKVLIIGLLILSTLAFGGLYIRELNRTCECSDKECEECKECEKCKKCDDTPTKSADVRSSLIKEYDLPKEGYKVLGVATSKKDYEAFTKDIDFATIDYEYQTNCAGGTSGDVTNCVPAPQLERDYDRYVYVLIVTEMDYCGGYFQYLGHTINEYININFREHVSCGPCAPEYRLYEIGLTKKEYNAQKVKVNFETDTVECDPDVAYKPIMYIYPEKDIDLKVTFVNEDLLTTTYPRYNNGWDIKVLKDGSIYDKDNKYYYALYWESLYNYKVDFREGFYVTEENAIEFLEEKLTLLGLNPKERNEFIMYWLPIIEQNENNLIYFETTDSLNKNEPLEFSIEPDTLIRIRMHIKKVDGYTSIKEQELNTPNRTGFTIVEWGGVKY